MQRLTMMQRLLRLGAQRAARVGAGIGLLVGYSQLAWAELQFNMTPGITEISHKVFNLHMTIFWICVVIGVLVFGVMFYSIVRHRQSRGVKPAVFHEHLGVEITWTVIPMLILIVMAVPATKTLLELDDTGDADIDILVTGHQWFWEYEYLEEDIHFYSRLTTPAAQRSNLATKSDDYLLSVDKPLVLPVNRKVRFLLTAKDVIHSWWVPALGWKKDTIPGFINEAWTRIDEEGIYRGQCAELCGTLHGFMPIVIDVRSEEDYDAWVAEQQAGESA